MTVKELIEGLSKYPEDAEVVYTQGEECIEILEMCCVRSIPGEVVKQVILY